MAVEDYHESLEQQVEETLQRRLSVKYNEPGALLFRGAAESVIQTVVYTTSVEAYRSSSGFDQLPWTVQAAAGADNTTTTERLSKIGLQNKGWLDMPAAVKRLALPAAERGAAAVV